MAKCEPRSEIYTDYINALKAIKEISRLTLDDARAVGNTNELVVGCGRQVGGHQGHGGRQSSQRHTSNRHPTSGRHHTPMHDHTMEEASQTANEMCLDTGYDMGCDATGPLPSMAHDDACPSYTFAHYDTSRSSSMVRDDTSPPTSSTTSLLPTTHTSPPPTTGIAPANVHGRDEMRFMPTPGAVPPEFVHTEFIQTEIPTSPPPPHQRLHTLRIDREGRNGHGHILLTVGLDMVRPVKEPVRRRKQG
ncbi:hypothetical protein CFP56_035943 [Quercus suber]|uniref:Uncharacterized protein n=1 Tax=Quercus suber TaxID=58331 RepID=A0AAW0J7Y2_QUESU